MKTEYQKCMNGDFFTADSEMLQITYRCKRLLRSLNDTDMENTSERKKIMNELLGSMGDNVHIDIDFHCEYGINIHCGSDVIINMNCTFVDNNCISIGNNVLIASDVKIYTATHTQLMLPDVLTLPKIRKFPVASVALSQNQSQ